MKKVLSLRTLSYLTAVALLILAACSDSNKIDFTATD